MITSFTEEQKAKRREIRLLKEINIPGFGEGKCHNVIEAFGNLHNLSHAPAIMVFGMKTLSKPSQQILYEALCDDVIVQAIKARLRRKMLLESFLHG